MTNDSFTEIQAGERVDTIANRTLGDPYKWSELVATNHFLDIWAPQPGETVVLPDVKRRS